MNREHIISKLKALQMQALGQREAKKLKLKAKQVSSYLRKGYRRWEGCLPRRLNKQCILLGAQCWHMQGVQ